MSTNTRRRALLIAACLLLLSANSAAVELIDSEARFLATAPIVSTEKFERDVDFVKIQEPTITIDDVTYDISAGRSAGCFRSSIRHCWSIEQQKGANHLSSGANFAIGMADWNMGAGEWDIIHFGDHRSVKAFGFYIQSAVDFVPKEFPGWEILVHEVDGGVTSFGVATAAAKKKPVYFGFISKVGISKIDVGSKPGRAAFNWDYLLVSRSRIEEATEIGEVPDSAAAEQPPAPAAEFVDNDDIESRGALFYDVGKKSPATGIVVARHQNGEKLAEVHVLAGKRHGADLYWHANGQMKSRGQYRDGRKHGLFESWHENGQQSATSNYSYGRMVGPATYWHENGQKQTERIFREGRKEGLESHWYEDGQLQSQAKFINGGVDGLYAQWHPNGRQKAEAPFVDGKQHGLMTKWHDNGQKEFEQAFEHGQRTGLQKQWYEDGSLRAELSFVNDKLQGPTTWWYQSGQKEMALHFKEGRLHGQGTFWHPNGQMKSDGEFKDGKATGRHSFWDEKGKKQRRRPDDYPKIPRSGSFR